MQIYIINLVCFRLLKNIINYIYYIYVGLGQLGSRAKNLHRENLFLLAQLYGMNNCEGTWGGQEGVAAPDTTQEPVFCFLGSGFL
jgi:hypothetical protein